MPTATYRQAGHNIDYTPASAVSAGDVIVLGDMICCAPVDIAANVKGALNCDGVWRMPKGTGSADAIAVGKLVYWDAGNEVVTETAGAHKKCGTTVAAAAASDATIDVKLLGREGS